MLCGAKDESTVGELVATEDTEGPGELNGASVTGVPVTPGGSEGWGVLIGGSDGATGEDVPGPRKVVGASVVVTGGIDSTGAWVASADVGDSDSMPIGVGVGSGIVLPDAVGAEVSTSVGAEVSTSVGAGVSPTGSGVIFIIVGIGVGRG